MNTAAKSLLSSKPGPVLPVEPIARLLDASRRPVIVAGYGDSAFYVHLTRGKEATALNFAIRESFGTMRAFRGLIHAEGDLDAALAEFDPRNNQSADDPMLF